MRITPLALAAVPVLVLSVGCAPKGDAGTGGSGAGSSKPSSSASPSAGACVPGKLPVRTKGRLTVGTDSPAYVPWFAKNDPTNGQGYESAVAYALAQRLGFDRSAVTWVKVPFNTSYAPGPKKFDFDINQISITPEREKVVDFSQGYYNSAQSVIALKGTKLRPGSLADLRPLRLGAQTGTTSLTAIREVIKPTRAPLVFNNTNTAKQALLNGQVDAIVADLPTAFFITSAEIEGATILGQFAQTGTPEQFGMLFEQGNPLRACVDAALAQLKADGTLARLEKKWLSQTIDVPVLK